MGVQGGSICSDSSSSGEAGQASFGVFVCILSPLVARLRWSTPPSISWCMALTSSRTIRCTSAASSSSWAGSSFTGASRSWSALWSAGGRWLCWWCCGRSANWRRDLARLICATSTAYHGGWARGAADVLVSNSIHLHRLIKSAAQVLISLYTSNVFIEKSLDSRTDTSILSQVSNIFEDVLERARKRATQPKNTLRGGSA